MHDRFHVLKVQLPPPPHFSDRHNNFRLGKFPLVTLPTVGIAPLHLINHQLCKQSPFQTGIFVIWLRTAQDHVISSDKWDWLYEGIPGYGGYCDRSRRPNLRLLWLIVKAHKAVISAHARDGRICSWVQIGNRVEMTSR